AWRDLLRNHPHDSICGCSCDEVHRDMLVRYEQLGRTLDYVEREALGVGGALVNALPYRRRRLVDGEVYELDGFSGARPEPFRSHGPLINYEGIAEEVRDESQFAVARRPLAPLPPRVDWVEPPVPTAHTLGAVALGTLVLLTKGLPEYEASEDGLRLTLLRCVGTISRPAGMPTRPLAAGPDIATPDGQCRGRHVLEYALRFDGDRLSNAALVRASQDYRADF